MKMEIIMKNQILSTIINKKSNKKFFKFQFLISIFIIVILIGFICYSSISLLKKEQMSKNITSNYSIYKLYSNNSKSNESSYTQNIQNEFFGTIEIPKINLYYPVFSHLDEELLKVSPWKGIVRFVKRGKLSPRYVGPFEIIRRMLGLNPTRGTDNVKPKPGHNSGFTISSCLY